jgi:hypothetical protein
MQLSPNEEYLRKCLEESYVCPICNGTQEIGHIKDCPLIPYMKFMPIVKVNDKFYVENAWGDYFEMIVKKILSPYEIIAYDCSIKEEVTIKGNIIIFDKDKNKMITLKAPVRDK